jgi:phosphohistidine phosphatase
VRLYLLRHGLADWPDWDPARDDERPLTREGIAKLRAEARALERLDLRLDAILSSPLARARESAAIVAERLGLEPMLEPALAPGFDAKKLRPLLQRHAKADALLLVGHEPDLSATIAELAGGARVALKKGGLARLDLESLQPPAGTLAWLVPAKLLIGR